MSPLAETLVQKRHFQAVLLPFQLLTRSASLPIKGACQFITVRDVSLFEGENPAGRTVARPMTQEPENIISRYTDAEALEDGVLVAMDALPVNRVTRAVFDRFVFVPPALGSPTTDGMIDITPLRGVIQAMLAVGAESDGWRVCAYAGKELWLVPNEVNGLTLMFPEDY